MIEYAINIEPLYPKLEFCEKIERVSAAGFNAIEFWAWDNKNVEKIKQTCKKNKAKVQAFGATTHYSLCDLENHENCIEWLNKTIDVAKELECNYLILFPNHFGENGAVDFRDKYSNESAIANITSALCKMAPILEENDIIGLLEPLANIGADSGMTVTDTSVGADIVRAVGSKNVRLLCDVFHMQVMHGNLLQNILSNTDIPGFGTAEELYKK